MAYLDATMWNDWQDTNAKNDKRFSEHGIVNLVKDSTASVDYVSPAAIQKLGESSSLRDVKIPVIKDQTVTVVQTPGFNFIPDNLTTSAEYSFTPVDVFSGFRHYPALYGNNTIEADFDRNVKMTNVANAVADEMESLLATTLTARKSQVLGYTTQLNQGAGSGTYSFTGGDVLTINKAAQQETMFSSLDEIMRANKLGGEYATVTSPAALAVQKLEALKFGEDNQKNIRAMGMIPVEDMHTSHNISTSANFDGYWVRKGAIGMYENFPYDFRNNTTTSGGEQWSISDVEIPFTRMRANIYTNKFAANATGLVSTGTDSNLIMSAGEEMAIWIRFYIVYRYNSDITTRAQDIVAIQGLTS
jgi:hypothetical protein